MLLIFIYFYLSEHTEKEIDWDRESHSDLTGPFSI